MDHEKQEFYVQFLFVVTEGDTPVEEGEMDGAEPKLRGPYPVGVLWVPTYQAGAKSKTKMTIFDDGKVMWLPKNESVDVRQIDHASFDALRSGRMLLVRSGGKSSNPCVFFATFADATRQRAVAMWGLPVAITKAKSGGEQGTDAKPQWAKLFRQSQTALEEIMKTEAEVKRLGEMLSGDVLAWLAIRTEIQAVMKHAGERQSGAMRARGGGGGAA